MINDSREENRHCISLEKKKSVYKNHQKNIRRLSNFQSHKTVIFNVFCHPRQTKRCRWDLGLTVLTLILAARAGNKLPNVYVFTEDQSKELKI
jgi:hypothetical protein